MSAAPSRRRVSVFGATGSIGSNTIDLLERQGGAETYEVVALSGAGNVALLAEQAIKLRARIAVTALPECYAPLKELLAGSGVEVAAGAQALLDAAAEPVDWTMSGIVGVAGLAPTLVSAGHGGVLALANKESLVAAGDLLLERCQVYGTKLLPTDSEHSAIFQSLQGQDLAEVERIILTASGGPFRTWSREEMARVTPQLARAHPNWNMGERISIDSSTMFNKALELIEAKHLFGVSADRIEVIIHPQSIVHSLVGFFDGAMLAHMGPPDMRGAIGFALNWPKRRDLPVARLDLAALGRLDFEAPDLARFPALAIAQGVLEDGGLSGAVFNAAKEQALDLFLAGKIGFLAMADLVEVTMERLAGHSKYGHTSYVLDDVTEIDAETRRFARQLSGQ